MFNDFVKRNVYHQPQVEEFRYLVVFSLSDGAGDGLTKELLCLAEVKKVQPEGKAPALLVRLHYNLHLRSRGMDRNQKSQKQAGDQAQPSSQGEEQSCCSCASNWLCWGSSSDSDDPLVVLLAGFPDMSHWEEALGQTQNLLEGLYILSGLAMIWDPQEELEREVWVSLLDPLPSRPNHVEVIKGGDGYFPPIWTGLPQNFIALMYKKYDKIFYRRPPRTLQDFSHCLTFL